MSESRDKPFFSAVIPAHNGERWIGEALESALAQQGPAFEVIVVDDGSTDRTGAVLASFGPRISVIRQDRLGVSAARNRGLEAARGEWVAFLDADDRWRPGHLLRLHLAIAARPGAGLAFADAAVIGENGAFIKLKSARDPGPDPFASILVRNTITTSAAAVRRDLAIKAGAFPAGISHGEDWDLWLRLARRAPVIHVPHLGADYRRHPGQAIRTAGTIMRDDNLRAFERILGLFPDISPRLAARTRAGLLRESAMRLLAGGDARAAGKDALAALRLRPFAAAAWGLFFVSLAGNYAVRLLLKLKAPA